MNVEAASRRSPTPADSEYFSAGWEAGECVTDAENGGRPASGRETHPLDASGPNEVCAERVPLSEKSWENNKYIIPNTYVYYRQLK